MKTSRRWLAAFLLTTCACSSATIYRHDAPDLEATIVGGSDRYLYVESEDGRVVRIARKNVTDLDHPGNVEAIIGGVLLAEGAALAGLGMASRNQTDRAIFGTFGGIIGVPGLILLAHGLIEWSRSNGAMDDRSPDMPLKLKAPQLGIQMAQPVTPTLPSDATPH